ncbi:MAG: (2Fe-2S)-binding protein, partial [Planctomycetes bacterium]|nr:(2Fe-2S)-binding protein [Planctomycetota bacterium]
QQLVDALNGLGIFTPTFCYHPDLKVAGNCRICLVETEGPRGFALGISCHMRPTPGMKVRTQASDGVAKARKGVMEFLLVNHPLDCPICDKAGECTLQEHYMTSGRHESRLDDQTGKVYKGGADHRFTDAKGIDRGGKAIDLGETVVLDQERCILCDRCVRFMRDVAGTEQLYLAGRGDRAYITTFPGEPLKHEYDLNVTDICPVGALTGKHFRFQQRVWMLKKVESIAPDDSLGANLTIEYNNGKIWRLMPRRNPAVNKSWISNSTRLLYQRLDQNRLSEAVVAGKPASLDQGLLAAGELLKKARKVAIVASGHGTTEDAAAALAFAEALGAGPQGAKAEVFGGSWLPVAKPDGIAKSGDPVANRKGLALLGVPENLDQLAARVGEFDCLLVINHDLWGSDAAKAVALEAIPNRVVLASWKDASVAKATIAVGVRCWAEVRGSMVNANGRVQLVNACPVVPNPQLDPPWQALVRLSGLAGAKPIPWLSEVDAWKAAVARVPQFVGISYRSIGPMGQQIVEAPKPAAVGAGA